jgi:hypothetical protein
VDINLLNTLPEISKSLLRILQASRIWNRVNSFPKREAPLGILSA